MAWPDDLQVYDRGLLAGQPPSEPTPPSHGALASPPVGGLARFFGNVARGVERVLSSPAYARLWSGMVSGMTGDPMAGPRALEELRRFSTPSTQDTLDQLRLRDYERREREAEAKSVARERLQQALGSGDPRSVEAAYAAVDPIAAARHRLERPPSPTPKAVVDPSTGKPVYVTSSEAIGREPYYRPQRGMQVRVNPKTGEVEVYEGVGVGTPSQIHDDIAQQANLDTTVAAISDALKTIRANRGATGIGGVIGKPLSGIAGGLEDIGALPPGSGAATAEAITGSSPEALQKLATIKESLVPALRPWMADKGPLSQQERTALMNAIGIMSATTDSRQAETALKTIIQTVVGNQIRQQRMLQRPHPLDPIASTEGEKRLARMLNNLGFTTAEIDAFGEALGYGQEAQ
jgi:hypothetical protein